MGRSPARWDSSVTDRRKGLHAEKETANEDVCHRLGGRINNCARPDRSINGTESDIAHKIEQQDEQQKIPPRHREQRVVEIERGQQWQASALDIERAVGVEQALAALSGYHRAKTEIAVDLFLEFGSFS